MPPTIASPLYILHLSAPETPHPSLLKDTDTHEISNPYYNASLPVWRDTVPTTSAEISAWKAEWTSPEAGEVIQAVGAWILCFRKARIQDDLTTLRTLLSTISEVIEYHSGASYSTTEPLLLAVGMQQTMAPSLVIETEEWEDLCRECGGWEWIDGTIEGTTQTSQTKAQEEEEKQEDRNEFGEKVGMARLLEALEAHEWEGGEGDGFEDLDDLGLDDDASLGFGEEAAEAQTEMWGLQSAVREQEHEDGEEQRDHGKEDGNEVGDQDVQELEAMMLKMQAARDMGADMPEGERKKFAAKAIREVLKKT